MWEIDSSTDKSKENTFIKGQIMSGHSDHYQKRATVVGADKCSVAVIYLDFSKIAWRRKKKLEVLPKK